MHEKDEEVTDDAAVVTPDRPDWRFWRDPAKHGASTCGTATARPHSNDSATPWMKAMRRRRRR